MDLDACNPVESKKPDRQVHYSETEKTPPGSPHVNIPGTLALDPGHERVPPLRGELDGICIHPGSRHPQTQVRLKVRDEAHILEGLAHGKEELPSVVPVRVGVP